MSLSSGFPRAVTSIVNGQIAQKGTAEILECFLEHVSLYFRKIHRQLRLDADFLGLKSCWFCLTAKFSCHSLPWDLARFPPHHVLSLASVLSHRTDFFPCPFHLTSLPTLQYALIGGFTKARATPMLWTVPSPALTEMALPANPLVFCLVDLCAEFLLWLWLVFMVLPWRVSQAPAWSLLP